MKSRKLLDAALFEPSAIETLKRTFDEAWGSIAATIEPTSLENARLSLANAIIAHAGVHGLVAMVRWPTRRDETLMPSLISLDFPWSSFWVGDLSALKAAALAAFRNGRQNATQGVPVLRATALRGG